MENKTEVINKTERANSFCMRYGGVGSDVKLYFDTEEELKKQIDIVFVGKKYLDEKIKEVAP